MLEVVNLSKIYKAKRGAEVKALDNVSIRFPEKGMVFLLGKSGSGKSTLLNVCGGLDSPTSGEVIVKGRSSKEFTQGDFDSYRNTYVGFIFQEYNILEGFSVEDNISLALELQGKPKDQTAINVLLEKVELNGLAKRKANTLSGGQKQRLAIARALIKSPEIIMADEPTGALDSETGRQVFETLKKLSKEKLVLVVSHDREFAEQYGDRIIELKDGKIISDVTRTSVQKTDNCESIEKEVFSSTNEDLIPKKAYSKEENRFIKSKMPLRHATKMGVSSLKTKPARLVFTILLCIIAFTMFGLVSTMMFYTSDKAFIQTLEDIKPNYIHIENKVRYETLDYRYGELSYTEYHSFLGPISEEKLAEVRAEYDQGAIGATLWDGSYTLTIRNRYYSDRVLYAGCYDDQTGVNIIFGRAPQTDGEIMISSYIADCMINGCVLDVDGNRVVANENQTGADLYNVLIGRKIKLRDIAISIVGVFESGEISSEYDVLKEKGMVDEDFEHEFSEYLRDGTHQLIFFSKNEFLKLIEEKTYWIGDSLNNDARCGYCLLPDGETNPNNYSIENPNESYGNISDVQTSDIVYLNGKTTLSDNEVIISFKDYVKLIENSFYQAMYEIKDEIGEDAYNEYIEIYEDIKRGYKNESDGNGESVDYTKEEMTQMFNKICEVFNPSSFNICLAARNNDSVSEILNATKKIFTVVGYKKMSNNYWGTEFYLSDSAYNSLWNAQKYTTAYHYEYRTNFVIDQMHPYQHIFVEYDGSEELATKLLSIYKNREYDENDSDYIIASFYLNGLETADEIVLGFSTLIICGGLVVAAFAALLLSNFITVSISNKKREIGILRALGARGADVFKIFFAESLFITLICMTVSCGVSYALCHILNRQITPTIGASVFNFGTLSVVVIVVGALLTSILATFLPVRRAAKKKPVESIRAL